MPCNKNCHILRCPAGFEVLTCQRPCASNIAVATPSASDNSSSHKMPSFADVTKDVQFMTVDEGNKAFVVYSNIARHFGH